MTETKKPKFALDIFAILAKLSTGDTQLWKTLSDEERKGLAPLVVMRWMSGTNDLRQIIFLNEYANPYIFALGANHPELMTMLLAVASSKVQHRYQWKGIKKKEAKSTDLLAIKVLKDAYEYSTREAREVMHLIDKTDIYELAESAGWQADELKKLKKELG